MPLNIDFSKFSYPQTERTQLDTSPINRLAEYHLRKKMHEDLVAHQNRVASDVNARFAQTQDENRSAREFDVQKERKVKSDTLLAKARTAVAQGKWNEADSYIGQLAELGVKVHRTEEGGFPKYRFEAPDFNPETGSSYEEVIGRINDNAGTKPPERVNVVNVDKTQQDSINPPIVGELSTTDSNPFDSGSKNPFAAKIPGTNVSDTTQTVSSAQSPPSGYDPYVMDTRNITDMNRRRLDPVLSGLQLAFPNRFQSQVGNFLDSVKSLNMSPESTLDVMQKPLDTVSRLYGSEMNSEGQMARASIGQGGSMAAEDRMRENESYNRTEKQARDIGLFDALNDKRKFESIRQRLASGNPNAVGDAVKELITLREGNRITDQDFQIGLSGVASNLEQLKVALQRIYLDGLPPNQLRNMLNMSDLIQKKNDEVIRYGAGQIQKAAENQRFEADTLGVKAWIHRYIPTELQTPENKNFDARQRQPGLPTRTKPVTRTNVSVTAPTTEEAAQTASELDEFLE